MNPFYNILAKLNAVTSKTPVETAKPTETVYESVEARGSITEAVKALEAKFATFKESKADDIADAKAEKEAGDWWGDKKKKDDKKDKREVNGSKYGGSKQKDDDEAKDKDDKKDAHHFKKTKKTEILDKDDEDEEDTDKELDEAVRANWQSPEGEVSRPTTQISRKLLARDVQDRRNYNRDSQARWDNDTLLGKAGRVMNTVTGQDRYSGIGIPGKTSGTKSGNNKGYVGTLDMERDHVGTKITNKGSAKDGKGVDEAFEFGSKNFKNASNLKKAPKAKLVKEGVDIHKRPIYEVPEAWEHFKKTKDEEELNKATQELDEISKLAGLPTQINVDMNKPMGAPAKPDGVTLPPAPIEQEPMLEMDDEWDDESGYDLDDPKHPTWAERQLEKADFARDYARENPPELDENITRAVLDDMKALTDEEYFKKYDLTKEQTRSGNWPRGMMQFVPRSQLPKPIDEEEMEEGNKFSGALAAAKASGAKEFTVGDDSTVYKLKEDINVSVTATGEEDALNLFRKLAGMPMVAVAQHEEEPCDGAMEVEVDEERDPEYVNSPREQVAPVSAAIPSGNDLHGAKRAYKISQPGDNPMAVAEAKDTSWDKYTSILKGLTK